MVEIIRIPDIHGETNLETLGAIEYEPVLDIVSPSVGPVDAAFFQRFIAEIHENLKRISHDPQKHEIIE